MYKRCLYWFFQGDSEIDQLFRIFRVLRTPTEKIWPGVTAFPDFKVELRTTTIATLYIQYIFPCFSPLFPCGPSIIWRRWWRRAWTAWLLTFWAKCWSMIQGSGPVDFERANLLKFSSSKRLSAKRALLHPYFDDLDKMALPAKPGEFYFSCASY